jgi:hypothetical protein
MWLLQLLFIESVKIMWSYHVSKELYLIYGELHFLVYGIVMGLFLMFNCSSRVKNLWLCLDAEVLVALVNPKVLSEVRMWFMYLWFIQLCCQFLRVCSIEWEYDE